MSPNLNGIVSIPNRTVLDDGIVEYALIWYGTIENGMVWFGTDRLFMSAVLLKISSKTVKIESKI